MSADMEAARRDLEAAQKRLEEAKAELRKAEEQLELERERARTIESPCQKMTEAMRMQMVRELVLPKVRMHFQRYPELQSALMCVAQYWDDEATDAVHCEIVFSKHAMPDIYNPDHHAWGSWDGHDYRDFLLWDDNGEAIPAFAAFCKEDCNQSMEIHEAYSPYALITRTADDLKVQVIGKMLRPWLDGVRPDWE